MIFLIFKNWINIILKQSCFINVTLIVSEEVEDMCFQMFFNLVKPAKLLIFIFHPIKLTNLGVLPSTQHPRNLV